jgi:hypothetical protein
MGLCCSAAHSASVAPAPPRPQRRFQFVEPSSLSSEELFASVSSCFTLVVYVPPNAAASGLAPGRHSRGHSFLLGGSEACKADPGNVTHWRSVEATAARALLIFSHRGGLEMPGGGRNRGADGKGFTEALCEAASRELGEETGMALAPPLGEADAALTAVERKVGKPRWQLYLRIVRSPEEFYAGQWSRQPKEMWGLVGVPLSVEDLHKGTRVNGFPRALAGMPPWQAELLLALLVKGGVLTGEEALVCAGAADAFLAAGGMRGSGGSNTTPSSIVAGNSKSSSEEVTLTEALQATLRDLAMHATPLAPRHFAPVVPQAAAGQEPEAASGEASEALAKGTDAQ